MLVGVSSTHSLYFPTHFMCLVIPPPRTCGRIILLPLHHIREALHAAAFHCIAGAVHPSVSPANQRDNAIHMFGPAVHALRSIIVDGSAIYSGWLGEHFEFFLVDYVKSMTTRGHIACLTN